MSPPGDSPLPPTTQGTMVSVDLGELRVADASGPILFAGPLGACVAVVIMDPEAKTGGLLQFVLPDSSLDYKRSDKQPGLFADTGIEQLVERVVGQGASSDLLQAYLVGGADPSVKGQDAGAEPLGLRNVSKAHEILSKTGISIAAERTGSHASRSVILDLVRGRIVVQEPQTEDELL